MGNTTVVEPNLDNSRARHPAALMEADDAAS